MKIYCRGRYRNVPAGLSFDRAGVYEVDEAKAQFLLRDAPGNFTTELPVEKAMDAPVKDKMVKVTAVKKSAG